MQTSAVIQAFLSWGVTVRIHNLPVWISFWTVLLGIILVFDAKSYIERQLNFLAHKIYAREFNIVVAAVIGAALMIGSICLHELGHALVARWFAYHITGAGISWWGAYVTLPDQYTEGSPWAVIMVSLAGPLTNFALAGIAALFVYGLEESTAENTIQYIAYMNYRLGKTNLIPIFVLDGGHAVWGFTRLIFGNSDLAFYIMIGVTLGVIVFWRKPKSKSKSKRTLGYNAPRDRFEQLLERL